MAEGSTQDVEEYEDDDSLSPSELAKRRHKRWQVELEAAKKELKKFQEEGNTALERFRAERTGDDKNAASEEDKQPRRLNVYTSDVQVMRDTLFGQVPKVDVSRRFGDAHDAPARLAGELLERILNADIEHDEISFTGLIEKPIFDYLTPGLGVARARYTMESRWVEAKPAILEVDGETGEEVQRAAEVPGHDEKASEDAETYYAHWQRFLWSPTPTWEECRWEAFGADMSRADLHRHFDESLARVELDLDDDAELTEEQLAVGHAAVERIPLSSQRAQASKLDQRDQEKKKNYPWSRAEVWEIWDKERRQVTWYVEGFDRVLKCCEDPLELKGFWPNPEPLMANLTNDRLVPTSDWKLRRSLEEEVDGLTARIGQLELACQVKGMYDRRFPDLQRLVDEALPGELIPVDNWAMFAKEGGIKGLVDWFPLEQVVETLDKLREVRRETIDLLRQMTGMADIIRGQQVENGTPGEAQIKAQFASVRMKARQKRIARFVSELQSIKAEIICKHFDTSTILARANYRFMPDAPDPANPQTSAQRQQLLLAAVALLRDRFHEYRIQVRPEALAAEDFAQKRAERTEFLGALSDLFSKAAPIAQAMPGATPVVAEIAQWAAAGLKGGKEIEGVFDELVQNARKQAAQPPPAPPPNPDALKLQAQQQAAQLKSQELQQKAQLDAQRMQQETQQDALRDQAEARQKAQEAATEHAQEMQADTHRAQLDVQKAREIQAMRPLPVVRPLPRGKL